MLSTEEVASIQTYNKLLEQGKTANEAFNVALSKSSDTVKQMASNAEGASIQLKAMTLSEKMAATGANILRIGLGAIKKIAIVAAINAVIKGLVKLYDKIVQVKKAGQTDISSTDTYDEYISKATEKVETDKKQIQVVKDIATQYKELSNSTISTDKKKEQLLQLQYKLIDSYGSEAKGIDLVNGKYDESIEKLKSLNEEKQKQLIDDSYAKYVKNRKAYNTQSAFLSSDNEDWLLRFNDAYQQLTRKNGSSGTRLFKTTDSNIFGQKSLSFDNARQAADEINKAYEKLINDTDLRTRNKSTWEDYVQKLDEIRVAVNKNADKAEVALSDYAQTVVTTVQQANNIDFSKISKSQYEKWKAELIKNYGQNDDTVISAISDYLGKTYIAAQEQTNTKKSDVFDITQFSEDIDNLQTKIKSLKETLSKLKDGSITQDELIDFTQEYGLTEYINDIPKLQSETEKLIQTSPDELINKLWELRKSLGDVDKAKVDNLITTLEQLSDIESVSDITNEINTLDDQINGLKDTIDGLDDQIKSIDEQLSNLKDRQSDLQDENSGMQQALEYLIEQNIRAIENQIEPHQKVVDKIEEENDKLEQQNDLYQQQLDLLNEKIGKYETTADVVKDAIQKEIDILNDRKQAVEDEYQARIDKMQQENDAINEQLELEKKKDAYENAKRRKKLVYTGAAGLQLVTDQTAVDETKKDYNDALASKKISDLEKERDIKINTIEKQIKSWEDYSQRWSDVVDNINKKQDEKTAKEILGSNWRKKINQQDISVLQTFASKYNFYVNVQKVALEKKIQQNEKDIKQNEKIIKSEQKVISEKQKIIEKWNDYKTELSNAISDIEGSNNKYISSLKNLVNGENLTLQNRNKYLSNFKAVYAKNIADINSITNSIKSLENTKTNLENSKTAAQDRKTSLEDKKKELETRANESDTVAKRVKYYIVKNKKGRTIQAFQNKKAAQVFIKDTIKESISDKVSADMAKLPTGLPADIVQNERVQSRKKWEKYYKNYYKVVLKYKTGGVADYTGMAQLDGSKSKSEVIFNSTDAKKLYDLVHNTTNLADMLSKRIVDTMQSGSNLDRNIQTNSSTVTPINIVIEKVVADNPVEFAKQMQAQIEYAFKQMNLDRMIGKIKK